MTSSTLAAIAVSGGLLVVLGGLKLAVWPWLARRRSWSRRPLDRS